MCVHSIARTRAAIRPNVVNFEIGTSRNSRGLKKILLTDYIVIVVYFTLEKFKRSLLSN